MLTNQLEQVETNRGFFERDPTWPYFTVTTSVFDTGVTTIDDQHRTLICHLEAIERTVAFPSRTFTYQSLENFSQLAVKHLLDEKCFMERMNYPAMDELQRDNEWTLIELERICDEFRSGTSSEFPAAIEALWQWAIEHIVESDRRYMPFLAKCRASME